MAIAILLTPKLIILLGPERWGLLTLILSLVGAFGVFDLGIGRALMRNVAVSIADPKVTNIASQVKTSLLLLLALGGAIALMLALAMPYWVNKYFKISANLKADSTVCFYILCLILPLILVNAGLWSVVSAFQLQRKATILGTPLAVLYYIAPLIIFSRTHLLSAVIWGILAIRLAQTYLSWHLAVQAIPQLPVAPIHFSTLRPVLKLSSWMTLSNLISPVLSYCDRLTLASTLSASAVGYYSTDSDLIGRLLYFPGIIGGTAFPAVATAGTQGTERGSQLIRRTLLGIILTTLPVSVCLAVFGRQILTIWLGPSMANQCEPALHWFALGLTFVACDAAFAGFIDALGHPKVNSLFSLGELLAFVPLLLVMIKLYGLEGAAAAWLVRVSVDLCIRFRLLSIVYEPIRQESRILIFAIGAVLPVVGLSSMAKGLGFQVASCSVTLALYAALAWTYFLRENERGHLIGWAKQATRWTRRV